MDKNKLNIYKTFPLWIRIPVIVIFISAGILVFLDDSSQPEKTQTPKENIDKNALETLETPAVESTLTEEAVAFENDNSSSELREPVTAKEHIIANTTRLAVANEYCSRYFSLDGEMVTLALASVGLTLTDIEAGSQYDYIVEPAFRTAMSDVGKYGVELFCTQVSINLSELVILK